jgi:outer membrane protein assembly factor BamB
MSSDSGDARAGERGTESGITTVDLGAVDPAGSRHLGRRSAVCLHGDAALVGTADGTVRAFAPGDGALVERWRAEGDGGSVVSLTVAGDAVIAGERGPAGAIRAYDAATGEALWRREAAADVGPPTEETRFLLPFVADVASDPRGGERVYAAARRYERAGDGRTFESVVYAFEADGTVAWRYRADASPIALDARGDRLAVAYNRCPGIHQCGLVVLDAATGSERLTWDPGTDGERRVGDVALFDGGIAVTSHGDKRGYLLDEQGDERWRADLATTERIGGVSVYAYPNHVHAAADDVAFVTGNTYPVEGRRTDARHPKEHAVVGFDVHGERRWRGSAGGFASGIATDGPRLAVPGAQNFRARDPASHGVGVFDLATGHERSVDADGVVTAAALDDGRVAAVEEPVAYHDGDGVLGSYRLRVDPLD